MITGTKLWKRMGPGGLLGLQIRSRVVIPAEVGSTPTRFRQFNCETAAFGFNQIWGGKSIGWIQ